MNRLLFLVLNVYVIVVLFIKAVVSLYSCQIFIYTIFVYINKK